MNQNKNIQQIDTKDFSLVTLDQSNYQAFIRFCRQMWPQRKLESYFQWRYLDAPRHLAALAMKGDECLASCSAFIKPYRFGDRIVDCLEPGDWGCLPEFQSSGLGHMVIGYFMDLGMPIVNHGGTKRSMSLVERFGWRQLGLGWEMALPFKKSGLGKLGRHRFLGPLAAAGLEFWKMVVLKPKMRFRKSQGLAYPVAGFSEAVSELHRQPSAHAWGYLADKDYYEWLCHGFPAIGAFLVFHFIVDEQLKGWALALISRTRTGCHSRIVDFYSPKPEPDLYYWMLGEVVSSLVAFEPQSIRTMTSCPFFHKALKSWGFITRWRPPLMVRAPAGMIPEGSPYIALGRGDDPLIIFPEHDDLLVSGCRFREGKQESGAALER